MNLIRALIMIVVCFVVITKLGKSLVIGETSLPPLAKFLDPFHGYLQNTGSEVSKFSKISSEYITEPVNVYFDTLNIPHIFASNDRDMIFAMGFIVAEQRLWQLDFQSLAAEGRISELIGKKGIEFDRQMRRIGMRIGSEKALNATKSHPEIYGLLEAYAEGVNAYIDGLSYRDYPIEYKLLDYAPERWSPYRSTLILQYMVNSLIGRDSDIEKSALLKILGEDQYNLLFPLYEEGVDPVIPTHGMWNFDPIDLPFPDSTYLKDLNINLPGGKISEPNANNGSNNWVIGAEKTKNGYPILANDPHLELRFPSLWIAAHLHSPTTNVTGFTFTGAPSIVIGLNDKIAWGFTNAPADQRDWFKITYQDDTREKYLYDGKYVPTEKVIETIQVKDAEPFLDTVIYTHHGPVVYDKNFKGGKEDLAFRWLGHEESETFVSLVKINRASNFEEFDEAVRFWDSPSQNTAFADVNGDIALRIVGKLPLKWQRQGEFILDGSNPRHNWKGFIPKEHNPLMLNPERGFVSSANQHSVDNGYPYFLYASNSLEHYRNRRINRILTAGDDFTVEDVMNMQLDNYSIKAEEILPLLLKETTSLDHPDISLLTTWDYNYTAGSKEAVLFEAWWRNVRYGLWDEFRDQDERLISPSNYTLYRLLKNHELPEEFYDNKSTEKKETWNDLVVGAWEKTVKYVAENNLVWKDYNKPRVLHLTQMIEPFATGIMDVGGSSNTLNAMNGSHGPSMRIIAEMSDPPKAWAVYPGGQSGNPGSSYYDSFLKKWIAGKYFRLDLTDNVKSNSVHTITFKKR